MKKSAISEERQSLLTSVGMELGREMSAQTVFFHEAIARRIDLNATDTRCLTLIGSAGGKLTAGDLGRATGLTTGAITGIIDRLENAGLVERERDASDRRKVFVRAKPAAMQRVAPLYGKLGTAMMKLASSYTTEELKLIHDFMERSLSIMKAQIADLS